MPSGPPAQDGGETTPSPHAGPGGARTHTCRAGSLGGVWWKYGAWSQSPGFRSNSANVLGSLALSNKMLTEAAVLTPRAACQVLHSGSTVQTFRTSPLNYLGELRRAAFQMREQRLREAGHLSEVTHCQVTEPRISIQSLLTPEPLLLWSCPNSLGSVCRSAKWVQCLGCPACLEGPAEGFSGLEKAGTQQVARPGVGQLAEGLGHGGTVMGEVWC